MGIDSKFHFFVPNKVDEIIDGLAQKPIYFIIILKLKKNLI